MSDLQKKWAKARVTTAMHAMAPPPLPLPLPEFNELDEDRFGSGSVPNTPQDDDSSSASSVSSTGTVIPSPGRALFARPQGYSSHASFIVNGEQATLTDHHSFPGRSLDPIPWTTYFERELFLPSADGSITYHAYLTSPAPSSGPGKPSGPLFVTHHGAGSSGLSFAVVGAEIRKRLPTAGILSLDARGHGLTTASSASCSLTGKGDGAEGANGKAEDLTLATLAADLLAVITLTQSAMHWPALPPIILVGHSLGGAVVTELAFSLAKTALNININTSSKPPPTGHLGRATMPTAAPGPTPPASNTASTNTQTTDTKLDLLGYAVLDVVEGSAMDALQSMHAYLATRPAGFDTLRDAVEWHVRSRTVRNAVSARVSVPGLLIQHQPSQNQALGGWVGGGVSGGGDEEGFMEGEGVVEEREGVLNGSGTGKKSGSKPWRWRTDLAKTQPFWEGWFGGLSKKFLSGRGGKMLLLAGTDRLDTELTIGQMQGMFSYNLESTLAGWSLTDWNRKICPAGVPRGGTLHPRGLAREDGDCAGRLPQEK
jgi:protein phosphatase methylesterase 1